MSVRASDVLRLVEDIRNKPGGEFDTIDLVVNFPDIRESVHFKHVLAAYYGDENAVFGEDVAKLLTAVVCAKIGFYSAERVKDHREAHERSQERREAAAEHLRKAAELSGFSPEFYINLIEKHLTTNGYGPEAERRADETRNQWAQRLNLNAPPDRAVSENLGKRGGSSNPGGATRALVVRMIAGHVPSNTRHRYAAISYFAKLAGFDVDNRLTRSILLKGRT